MQKSKRYGDIFGVTGDTKIVLVLGHECARARYAATLDKMEHFVELPMRLRQRGCLKSPDCVKFGQLPNIRAESYARTLSVEISGFFKHPLRSHLAAARADA
jgi:hypothetical protein